MYSIKNYISNSLMEEKIADKFINKILQKIRILEFMPKTYNIIQGIYQESYRRMTIGNYLVIYTIDEENKIVYVARIIYGGRDLYKLHF